MLINVPTKVPMESIATETQKLLSGVERDMTVRHCPEFPLLEHSGDLLTVEVICNWGKEGHWRDPKKRAVGEDTSHRKVPTFIYEKLD